MFSTLDAPFIHQQLQGIFFPHPYQQLILLVFLVIAHCGFIFISLMISDVEHFFMYLLIIQVSLLEKFLFIFFVQFFIGCLLLSCMSYLYIFGTNSSTDIWLEREVAFSLLECFFSCAEVLQFAVVLLANFWFYCLYFWCHIPQKQSSPRSVFSSFFTMGSRSFVISGLMFKSLIHFEFIFVIGIW